MDNVDSVYWYLHQWRAFSLDCSRYTFSAFPLTPTRVPRLVYRFCEADNDTERSEWGAPSTSNLASAAAGQLFELHLIT